jgi:hypothetical protein
VPDSFSDAINKFTKKVESVTPASIPFSELFTPDFMRRRTKSATMEAFFDAGGYDISSQADFEKIDAAKFDAHVRAQSSFDSWDAMKVAAYEEWAQRKMR